MDILANGAMACSNRGNSPGRAANRRRSPGNVAETTIHEGWLRILELTPKYGAWVASTGGRLLAARFQCKLQRSIREFR